MSFDNNSSLVFILLPTLGSFAQVVNIYQTKSSNGFSKLTSGITIMSSIIKIFYWFTYRINDYNLLLEGVVPIISQVYILKCCVDFKEGKEKEMKEKKGKYNNNTESDSNQIESYGTLISMLSILIVFVIQKLQPDSNAASPFLIIIRLLDAIAPIPQIILNFYLRSTEDFSFFLLLSWIILEGVKLSQYQDEDLNYSKVNYYGDALSLSVNITGLLQFYLFDLKFRGIFNLILKYLLYTVVNIFKITCAIVFILTGLAKYNPFKFTPKQKEKKSESKIDQKATKKEDDSFKYGASDAAKPKPTPVEKLKQLKNMDMTRANSLNV